QDNRYHSHSCSEHLPTRAPRRCARSSARPAFLSAALPPPRWSSSLCPRAEWSFLVLHGFVKPLSLWAPPPAGQPLEAFYVSTSLLVCVTLSSRKTLREHAASTAFEVILLPFCDSGAPCFRDCFLIPYL
ncbi:unnamed protein product, partial [Ectocarpus sp. 13 AM-2016]